MDEWGDSPPTFDRSLEAWGGQGSFAEGTDAGGGEQYVEMIGSQLRVAGMISLGRFRSVADYVNLVDGYLVMGQVVVLARTGEPTRLALPELRVLPADIAVVGQYVGDTAQASSGGEKLARRLVVITRSHIVDGDIAIHGDSSLMAFLDASDPKFISMANVRVRWLSDRRLAARFPFALLQRAQIQSVATEGIEQAHPEESARRLGMLRAQARAAGEAPETDVLGGEIGSALGVVGGPGPGPGPDPGPGPGSTIAAPTEPAGSEG